MLVPPGYYGTPDLTPSAICLGVEGYIYGSSNDDFGPVWSEPSDQAKGVGTGLLGKNRDTPPSPQKRSKKKSLKSPNRDLVLVAVASRLMARYWYQTGENLKGSSVSGCGRWRNYGYDQNIAEIEVQAGHARMLGHFRCKNAWSCEHCARARVAQTRSWIRAALIPALDKANLSASLVTLTLAHAFDEDWSAVVDRLARAYNLVDKRMAKEYSKAGSIGKLKAVEATVGVNGLHPHLHILLTHSKDADLKALTAAMSAAWSKAVGETGGSCTERGFDLKANCLNDYLAKRETSHELANHSTKASRLKGKTLAQLLLAASHGDELASDSWLRAQKALGGRKRFHAGSLPKNLGIVCPSKWADDERDAERDAERAELPEPTIISYQQDRHLTATSSFSPRAGLALILRAARTGESAKVLSVVDALCNEVNDLAAYLPQFNVVGGFEPSADLIAQVLKTAAERPMDGWEVEVYLYAKSRGISANQT